jgi:hypothetical protein
MPVFYPFGIPFSSSYAETASFARFTDLTIQNATFANVAIVGPTGSKGDPAIPSDCALYGAEYRPFPTPPSGFIIPPAVEAARQSYILCVLPEIVDPFVVPTILDGGTPTNESDLIINGGVPGTIYPYLANGGTPATEINE